MKSCLTWQLSSQRMFIWLLSHHFRRTDTPRLPNQTDVCWNLCCNVTSSHPPSFPIFATIVATFARHTTTGTNPSQNTIFHLGESPVASTNSLSWPVFTSVPMKAFKGIARQHIIFPVGRLSSHPMQNILGTTLLLLKCNGTSERKKGLLT